MTARALFAALALTCAACGDPPAARPPGAGGPASVTATAPRYPAEDAAWGRYHSKRFNLSFPLPDGKGWRIDDHSRPWLFAMHDATASKLWVIATQEDELVNRQKCETRARNLGWVASSTLTTVEDEVTVGPEAYDSRIWVALDAAKQGGKLEGHLYLFGAFIRRCLLVHVATSVASAREEDVLSERLALARARIVRGLQLDLPRTSDDAAVPRDKADVQR
ncbi:MAG: hypothetical protein JWP97_2105 [Labilithrix sp.]|nr:hypothetical protein [Labilithrix sp.]